ncbi:RcpC/CpaB family pilus assembly protein [Paenibacillus sp. Leaf72]|uniref:RcpC/CpaB family pilus assembly protein n=1 Tax=Paenibacillus sp. Leaf72 TaxID=1736234 RepID=UPI0006F20A78|nr:SAF domain-containing protein [Paenibacillus sp. Leaf72]KQN97025.1 hypothetical protein ASF12_23435 [Paenibacillus sp. Leaf72]
MKKRRLLAILGAALVVGAFFFISEYKVKNELQATLVYFAVDDIPAHTEITEAMVEGISLPKKGLPPGIILNKAQIVGKFTQAEYGIPKNGFFYQQKIVTEDELMDAARMKLQPGQKLWTGDVNLYESAAGNVLPGTKVDVWFQAVEQTNDVTTGATSKKWIAGSLYEGVQVISAKNKKAEDIVQKNTTTTTDANGKTTSAKKELYPTVVQLAVSEEQFQLLTASTSSAFSDSAIILVPQPDDKDGITLPDVEQVNPLDIKEYIKSKQLDLSTVVSSVVKGAE